VSDALPSTVPVVDEYVARRPAPALRRAVDLYTGYRQRGMAPALHRGLPSPYLTVIFTLDEQLDVARHADPRQSPDRYDALIGGLHTAPALIRHQGAQSGVQLQVNPLWSRRLLGVPAGELVGIDLHAEDLFGRTAADIQQQLQSADAWPDRFAVLDRALLSLLAARGASAVSPEVGVAWRRLRATRGTTSVAALVREVGWSDRQLAQRFRREIGLTPKAAARVIRFDAARRRLQRGDTTVGQVAAAYGYYDQPHLVREFGSLAGCPPTQWLAAEFGGRAWEPTEV
jgi:AraC-like DNA-binding protein